MSVKATSHHRTALFCFDVSGCSAPLLENEIRKFLDPKTFHALDNLRAEHEIKQVRFQSFVFNS